MPEFFWNAWRHFCRVRYEICDEKLQMAKVELRSLMYRGHNDEQHMLVQRRVEKLTHLVGVWGDRASR